MEETLAIIKPDGTERGLADEIVLRIKSTGLAVTDSKDIFVTKEQAEKLYAEHKGRHYYEHLLEYIMSGKVRVVKISGDDAVSMLRSLMGSTDPSKAQPGSIRYDFRPPADGSKVIKNTIHGSDSIESAKREARIFFT